MNTADLIAALQQKKLNLVEYVNEICDRIEREESTLQAIVPGTYDREALLSQATECSLRDPDNQPLYGLPIGVKDIFRADGYPTTCGSRLPVETFRGTESHVVTLLKKAGAIVVGKTITTEFAAFHPGPTTNPANPLHTPGGSSSGSAAGVAKGYFPFAFGSQTIGSIARPATFCGVVGVKPSYGRVSAEGVIEYSRTMDHVGWLCEDTSALNHFSQVLINNWRGLSAEILPANRSIGVPEGPYIGCASALELQRFAKILDQLKEFGISIVPCPVLEDFETIRSEHQQIIMAELSDVHRDWFADHQELYSEALAELIVAGQKVDRQELARMVEARKQVRSALMQRMDEAGVDALIAPGAVDVAPRGIESTGDPVMNLPWTYTGLPSVSLPCRPTSATMPHGVQLIGRFNQDEELFALADLIASHVRIDA